MMDLSDEFYLAWLARECRFQASVHWAPRTRLGYRVYRRVIVSPIDEPALNLWLATKGVHGRVLRDKSQIRLIIELLRPVATHVAHAQGLKKMLQVLNVPSTKSQTYEGITSILEILDSVQE